MVDKCNSILNHECHKNEAYIPFLFIIIPGNYYHMLFVVSQNRNKLCVMSFYINCSAELHLLNTWYQVYIKYLHSSLVYFCSFLSFNKYRIPREYLLNKTGDVTPEGKYVTPYKVWILYCHRIVCLMSCANILYHFLKG